MTKPTTTELLLRRMRTAHAALEDALGRAGTARWQRPGVSGDWSIKDVLAHLAFWEERTRWRLSLPPEAQPASISEAEMRRLNARARDEGRERSAAEALTGHRRAYEALLRAVAALDDAPLNDRERLQRDGAPVWQHIADNTYNHYDEHAAEIRAWLDTQDAGAESAVSTPPPASPR